VTFRSVNGWRCPFFLRYRVLGLYLNTMTFFVSPLGDDLGRDLRTGNRGVPDDDATVPGHHKYVLKLYSVAFIATERLDTYSVPRLDSVLLSACLDDRVVRHIMIPRSHCSGPRRGASRRIWCSAIGTGRASVPPCREGV